MNVALDKYANNKINFSRKERHENCLFWLYLILVRLLNKHNSFSIHERNIKSLGIEIDKFLNDLSAGFLNNAFHKNASNPYALQNRHELYARNPKAVRHGTETVSYMAPKIWSSGPETIRMSSYLETRMCLSPLYKIFATCCFRLLCYCCYWCCWYMSSICHSYVLVCHSHVARMWFYHEHAV